MFLNVASVSCPSEFWFSCSVLDMFVSVSSSSEMTFSGEVISRLEENVDHQCQVKVYI